MGRGRREGYVEGGAQGEGQRVDIVIEVGEKDVPTEHALSDPS